MELVLTGKFASAHRYYKAEWSEEENQKAFGACVRVHGHDYKVECFFMLPPDDVENLNKTQQDLTEWLKQQTALLCHQRLDQDIEFFRSHVPTTENIAFYFFSKFPEGTKANLQKVRIWEGDSIFAEIHRK